MISGLGILYSPPILRDGILHRGVLSAEDPISLVRYIDTRKWVITHYLHCARPPILNPVTDLYQCDPFFNNYLGDLPRVNVICRDFTNQDVYRPLKIEKNYDVVFNACWSEVKRPLLFAEALKYAKMKGRPISCVWYGYHWQLPSGASTSHELEYQIRTFVSDLPVTFLETNWNAEENNRRFNSARVAVLPSTSEGGPKVMSEAMLAGLPYLTAADIYGGSSLYLTKENKNGTLFQPSEQSIAQCIWDTLDKLEDYSPREWALNNMCRAVSVVKLQEALKQLEKSKGWNINWQDVDYDGYISLDWWKPILAANAEI